MIQGRTFVQVEIDDVNGDDLEVRLTYEGHTLIVNVACDAKGLRQLNRLLQGLNDMRNRFPAYLVRGVDEEKS